jgi:hypothetical protein
MHPAILRTAPARRSYVTDASVVLARTLITGLATYRSFKNCDGLHDDLPLIVISATGRKRKPRRTANRLQALCDRCSLIRYESMLFYRRA